jgi:hypothetical protein
MITEMTEVIITARLEKRCVARDEVTEAEIQVGILCCVRMNSVNAWR